VKISSTPIHDQFLRIKGAPGKERYQTGPSEIGTLEKQINLKLALSLTWSTKLTAAKPSGSWNRRAKRVDLLSDRAIFSKVSW
jgi:hypothetical protein